MLTLGSALVSSAILLTVLIAFLFRRPDPPRWTKPDLVAMLAGRSPDPVSFDVRFQPGDTTGPAPA